MEAIINSLLIYLRCNTPYYYDGDDILIDAGCGYFTVREKQQGRWIGSVLIRHSGTIDVAASIMSFRLIQLTDPEAHKKVADAIRALYRRNHGYCQ